MLPNGGIFFLGRDRITVIQMKFDGIRLCEDCSNEGLTAIHPDLKIASHEKISQFIIFFEIQVYLH